MFIGRHRSRYEELGNIGCNDTDLAIARFGRASVSCWTSPGNRTWGTHARRQAGVMRFHVDANPGSEDGLLSNFELELRFSRFARDPVAEDPGTSQEESNYEESQVSLIGPPAPRYVRQDDKWTFCSDRLSDEQTGHARAARWTWESAFADELSERVLYGGVALYHPGQPFQVSCHVRGKVTKPRNIILKFSDQHHQPRSWKLTPQICERDLRAEIDALEAHMKQLNCSSTSTAHRDIAALAEASTLSQLQRRVADPGGSIYGGDSSIGGSAQVQFGNIYYYGTTAGNMPAIHSFRLCDWFRIPSGTMNFLLATPTTSYYHSPTAIGNSATSW